MVGAAKLSLCNNCKGEADEKAQNKLHPLCLVSERKSVKQRFFDAVSFSTRILMDCFTGYICNVRRFQFCFLPDSNQYLLRKAMTHELFHNGVTHVNLVWHFGPPAIKAIEIESKSDNKDLLI